MSRAARRPKTPEELEQMQLQEINAYLSYLRVRLNASGGTSSGAAKAFRKEITVVERVRAIRFGVRPHSAKHS